jgi:CRP/FNR family cyclic AMP-dependent transcriptional regulator
MDQELNETLLQSQLCKYLDLNDLDMLIGHSKIISFAPGDVLLQQGEKSAGTYIIIYGTAVVSAKVINNSDVKSACC